MCSVKQLLCRNMNVPLYGSMGFRTWGVPSWCVSPFFSSSNEMDHKRQESKTQQERRKRRQKTHEKPKKQKKMTVPGLSWEFLGLLLIFPSPYDVSPFGLQKHLHATGLESLNIVLAKWLKHDY